ncbi:FlgD immunoglobulin-like domain containing protein [Thermodesulfobacteriota bacterium]
MSINFKAAVRKISFVSAIVFALTVGPFCHDPGKAFAAETKLSVVNVRIDRTTLSPGEEVMIYYRLTEDAKVSLYVYGPDYVVVRRLLDGIQRPAGTNNITWDGRDDSGGMVPDEAYIFSIVAEDKNGQRTVYDPTSYSGGEILYLKMSRLEKNAGNYTMYYSIPVPARVCIRAGVHKGPMLKTILDWRPLSPGEYSETWDGWDGTGRIRVMDEPGSILYIKGFKLPENTIIVQVSNVDYHVYYKKFSGTPIEEPGGITKSSVKQAALQRRDKGLSPEYLVPRALNVAPRFFVYQAAVNDGGSGSRAPSSYEKTPLTEKANTGISGTFDMTVEVAPESMTSFNESRYEIVVFVDNKRFDEEESAYSPYTYSLDTTKLANGEHAITINLASLTGQVGTYSFMIRVKN